jgi:hypothetical protein
MFCNFRNSSLNHLRRETTFLIRNHLKQFGQPVEALLPETFFAYAELGRHGGGVDGALGAQNGVERVFLGVELKPQYRDRLIQRKPGNVL